MDFILVKSVFYIISRNFSIYFHYLNIQQIKNVTHCHLILILMIFSIFMAFGHKLIRPQLFFFYQYHAECIVIIWNVRRIIEKSCKHTQFYMNFVCIKQLCNCNWTVLVILQSIALATSVLFLCLWNTRTNQSHLSKQLSHSQL